MTSTKWIVPEGYAPTEFTHPSVLAFDCTKKPGGWADPQFCTEEFIQGLKDRHSHVGFEVDAAGFPLNPNGPTGKTGRGMLGKYGPNHAADPLVTRRHGEDNRLQMVVILRDDVQQWAIPGGMVEDGETVSLTLMREFKEEAKAHPEGFDAKLEHVFATQGREVFRGMVVDDPRNTDQAWMETVCVNFHLTDPELKGMQLKAGSDALKVQWVDITPDLVLYANHKDFVNTALAKLTFD